MEQIQPSQKTKVRRAPKRANYDRETIYSILDAATICHVGFIHNHHPVVIPTIYGRSNDFIYLHGAVASRMIKELEKGIEICLSVAIVDGLVLARSAFHHSMNYRSVVIFGSADLVVDDKEKNKGLKAISDQVLKGRWEEVRLPNPKELKATKVLKLKIEEASAKVRTGKPLDDKEDYHLPIWAGEVPLVTFAQSPISDPELRDGISIPQSVTNLYKS